METPDLFETSRLPEENEKPQVKAPPMSPFDRMRAIVNKEIVDEDIEKLAVEQGDRSGGVQTEKKIVNTPKEGWLNRWQRDNDQ